MSRTPRRLAQLAAAGAVALALAACSSGGGTDPAAVTGDSAPAELTPPAGTIISANSTAQLGTVVVDGIGWTLYRSDADSTRPPASTCDSQCALEWPPVLAEPGAPLTVEGVAEDLIGTITRADGGVQLTIAGSPVYRHAADPAPGAVDGNGIDDNWFAITPDGSAAEAS